ncbi:MAG TPA: hypothetical protein VN843_04390 [Anaerolineales bacterium]|nr:hypothetical protein [Anaerolineales bacterium]
MSKTKEKIVPLVVYEEGVRRIIGSAKLIPGGDGLGISARVTDRKLARELSGSDSLVDICIVSATKVT